MNKHRLLHITAFALCVGLGLAFVMLFWVSKDVPDINSQPIKKEKAVFDESCLTRMQQDTLSHLMKRAYAAAVEVKEEGNRLAIHYTATDQSAPAFYNGNEALTTFDEGDHGFSIEKTDKGLTFTMQIKDGMVPVPNDILIRLLSKYKTDQPGD